jgi:hypothetical protein
VYWIAEKPDDVLEFCLGTSSRVMADLMTLGETLTLAWQQSLVDGKGVVELWGECFPVAVFRAKKLRGVEFRYGELLIVGIEQNPKTGSQWAALALT